MTALLSIAELGIRYGAIEAVRGVSLDIRESEIVTLLGANGAGKSSVLNGVMGLVSGSSGSIRFREREIRGLPPERIVGMGMTLCPEGRRVFANLTVGENLTIGAASRRDRQAVSAARQEMLALFPVLAERESQLAGTLSGGEQQMLAIARAMMSAPGLLLLDEPSLGLAPQIVETIFELIVELRNRGVTILLVEQNVELALEIADRGYVLASGRIVLAGDAVELRQAGNLEQAYLGIH